MMTLPEISSARRKLVAARALIDGGRFIAARGGEYGVARLARGATALLDDAIRILNALENQRRRGRP